VKQSAILGHHKAAEIFLNYSIDSGLKRAAWGHERAGTMGVSCRQGKCLEVFSAGNNQLELFFLFCITCPFFSQEKLPYSRDRWITAG